MVNYPYRLESIEYALSYLQGMHILQLASPKSHIPVLEEK
jgi:hypothetical protein